MISDPFNDIPKSSQVAVVCTLYLARPPRPLTSVTCHMSLVTCHMSYVIFVIRFSFFLDKVVEIVLGGSFIKGLTPSSFYVLLKLFLLSVCVLISTSLYSFPLFTSLYLDSIH